MKLLKTLAAIWVVALSMGVVGFIGVALCKSPYGAVITLGIILTIGSGIILDPS